MEEAHEFLGRFKEGKNLPLITSCSPGWIKYCEHYFPEFTDNLSSCKSPQQMFGAMYKTYYAAKIGVDPKDIFFVSAIPCTAKKFEVTRDHQNAAGVPDVDVAITTRELARMIQQAGIDFRAMEDAKFDDPFGIGSGAGAIFGATGGVMEAALRTAAEVIEGKPLEKLEFEDVRGIEGIKRATYTLGGNEIKVAVASGTANAKKLLTAVRNGEEKVDFIEIMACPGGCVNGGGQPTQPAVVRNNVNLRELRASVLYTADKKMDLRKSHENSAVKKLYDEYFGNPGSHKAHEVLHTKYVKRGLKNN
jgi:NADP-reducing hydrogenase subunit HndD